MPSAETGAGAPITLIPIGTVHRPPTAEAAEARPSIEALRAERVSVVLNPRYADGLLGLEPGADILVLCYFDRAGRDILQVHPRGDQSRPMRGVFATRSPARPNPISVTSARVLDIDGTTLHVTGLDALDGTPVIDIKPHSAGFDQPFEDI